MDPANHMGIVPEKQLLFRYRVLNFENTDNIEGIVTIPKKLQLKSKYVKVAKVEKVFGNAEIELTSKDKELRAGKFEPINHGGRGPVNPLLLRTKLVSAENA